MTREIPDAVSVGSGDFAGPPVLAMDRMPIQMLGETVAGRAIAEWVRSEILSWNDLHLVHLVARWRMLYAVGAGAGSADAIARLEYINAGLKLQKHAADLKVSDLEEEVQLLYLELADYKRALGSEDKGKVQ